MIFLVLLKLTEPGKNVILLQPASKGEATNARAKAQRQKRNERRRVINDKYDKYTRFIGKRCVAHSGARSTRWYPLQNALMYQISYESLHTYNAYIEMIYGCRSTDAAVHLGRAVLLDNDVRSISNMIRVSFRRNCHIIFIWRQRIRMK